MLSRYLKMDMLEPFYVKILSRLRSFDTFIFCVSEHSLNAVCLMVDMCMWLKGGCWYHTLDTVRTYMAEYCLPNVFVRDEIIRQESKLTALIASVGEEKIETMIPREIKDKDIVEEIEMGCPLSVGVEVVSMRAVRIYNDKINSQYAVKKKK